jgi:hypothetical protein
MAPNYAERIKPVDRDRFKFALSVFGAAADLKGPTPNPAQYGVNIRDDDGSVTEFRFTDRPENRGLLAVKREFKGTSDLESMCFRILNLPEVIRMERLSRLEVVQIGEGQTMIHDSVIYALAQAPFRKSGKLDKAAFVAAVKSEYQRIEGEALDG